MNHDSELDNPLFQRLWDAQASVDRLEFFLCLAFCVIVTLLALIVLMYLGPVCVPIPRGE